MITTAGQLLVNKLLPPELRDYNRVLDKKGVRELLRQVAERYPERYVDISKGLSDVGREIAYYTGGDSVGLDDLEPSSKVTDLKAKLRQEIEDLEESGGSDEERQTKILERMMSARDELVNAVLEDAKSRKNPLVRQLAGAGRGNKNTLNSMLGGDVAYVDHKNNPIPLPVLHSYAEGLTPAEYFAGSFGARKGLVDLKCLAKGTLVRMADWSVKPIEQVRPGEYVLGANLAGQTFPVRVLATFDNGLRECFEYRFTSHGVRGSLAVTATPDHKILAKMQPGPPGSPDGHLSACSPTKMALSRTRVGCFVAVRAAEYSGMPGKNQAKLLAELKKSESQKKSRDSYGTFDSKVSQGLLPTYDLHVDHEDHLFVLANGMIVSNSGTAQSGFMAKQLLQVAHRLLTTQRDDDRPYDETNPRGLPTDIDDPDNEGSRLANTVGGYPRNTILTPAILADLKRQGIQRFLVRSPTVGGPEDGGVYVNDIGMREKGVPPLGDMVGIAAANALAEPITQMTISSKHCLAKGTLVLMGDWTAKPIEDVRPGDTVMRPVRNRFRMNKFTSDVAPVEVVNVFNNGVRPCRTYYFVEWPQDGRGKQLPADAWWPIDRKTSNLNIISLTATDDHKIVSRRDDPAEEGGDCHAVVTLKELWDNQDLAGIIRCCRCQPVPASRAVGEEYAAFKERWDRDFRKTCFMRIVFECDDELVDTPTYDLEVDHEDHLFVLANGLIVSNSGGALGAQAGAIEGFKAIEALVNPADEFVGFAAHSKKDGVVRSVEPAPQGGFEIDIDGEKHFVPPGQQPSVKVGQTIEAGDAMSSGLPDPASIVEYKGVGEGRRYFINTFRDLIKRSGAPVHRRNVELLSRGLINHVRLNDELDEYGPDDVVPYQWLERRWQPRKDAFDVDPRQAGGLYLEKPVLHYTIGTPIRPSMIKTLGDYGVKKITAHKQAPPFQSEVLRGMAQASNDPDWMTRMLGSYQQKSLLTGVHRGAVSDMGGSSFVPALAAGVKFDDVPATTGWDPKTLKR